MAGLDVVWGDALHMCEQPHMVGHGLGYAPWACNGPKQLAVRGKVQVFTSNHQHI